MSAVQSLLLSASTNLTLVHPIWRALIAVPFRSSPDALSRIKGMLRLMYDTIADPKYTTGLSCNVGSQLCSQTRMAPGDQARKQVRAGYWDAGQNTINVCGAFFGLPEHRKMKCLEGEPMSLYSSTGTTFPPSPFPLRPKATRME